MYPVFNPVAPYRYLLPTVYLFMADIANSDLFVCGCRTAWPVAQQNILFLLVSVDFEYHDGWCALKSPRIRVSGIVRRCSIEN